ncbi:MAG: HNH endonuclease [Candidatus Diapherotrites archaeon]|uniref:HNH endonuclease n=1 Tax=Candidatus Iainarchaeum sp. TaxID=3101447 RepID=A0A8T4L2R3_9ARCH|nr:HNH endonuclease [Candidatus Diapherotrites archaeon]
MADTYIDKKGYRRFSDSSNLVHQWVAEQKVGGPLRPGSVVHHKDRDKLNNDPDNLWVFKSQKKHWKTHQKDGH